MDELGVPLWPYFRKSPYHNLWMVNPVLNIFGVGMCWCSSRMNNPRLYWVPVEDDRDGQGRYLGRSPCPVSCPVGFFIGTATPLDETSEHMSSEGFSQ